MNFTPEQHQAISHTDGPLRILASAGSGKTSVLTQKVIRLILEGKANPSEILILTFTNKAAGEIRERIEKRLFDHRIDYFHDSLRAETFNSFGNAILMEEFDAFGLPEGGVHLLTEVGRWRLLSDILKGSTLDHLEISSPDQFISKLFRFIDSCKDNLITPARLSEHIQSQRETEPASRNPHYLAWMEERYNGLSDLARLYQRYEELKRGQNLIDYGDQILIPALKLQTDPAFRRQYQQFFRYIFVDEYQDTNFGQKEFLLQLIDPQNQQVTVVGDDDQAIYGWRGAVVENILNFHQEGLFNRQTHSLVLSTNFRCAKSVVRAANQVLEPFKSLRPEKILKTPDQAPEGSVISNSFNSDEEEMAHIANAISAMIRVGQNPSEIAILCRNRKFFGPFAQTLEKASVPYQIMESAPLLERWEVKEMLCYLRLIADENDDMAMVRLLCSRRVKLGDGDLYLLARYSRDGNLSLWEASEENIPQLSSEAHLRLKTLASELNSFASIAYSLSIPDLVLRMYETVFRPELERGGVSDYAVAQGNLVRFVETSRRFYEENPQSSLFDFLQYLEFLGSEESETPSISMEESAGVKLMTLHKAKGLEFDVVFLPFLAEKVLPSERSENPFNSFFLPEELRGDNRYWPRLSDYFQEQKVTKKGVEDSYKGVYKEARIREERRLFYVGVTRARRELYFSHSFWIGENDKRREPSLFLKELEGTVEQGESPLYCTLYNPYEERMSAVEATPASHQELLPGADILSMADLWAVEHQEVEEWLALKRSKEREVQEVKNQIMKLQSEQQEAPDRFSYSSLFTYRQCPKKYWYRYLSGIPVFPDPEEGGDLGKAVHRAIELFGKGPFLPAELEGILLSIDPKIDLKTAKELFMVFHDSKYGQEAPYALEFGFNLSLPEVASFLVGRIDRIQRTSEGEEIVDYKTGKPKPLQDESVLLQMGIYTLAVQDLWNTQNKGPIINIMFNLRENRIESKIFSIGELENIRQGIMRDIRQIQKGAFPAAPENKKCAGCDYSNDCHSKIAHGETGVT